MTDYNLLSQSEEESHQFLPINEAYRLNLELSSSTNLDQSNYVQPSGYSRERDVRSNKEQVGQDLPPFLVCSFVSCRSLKEEGEEENLHDSNFQYSERCQEEQRQRTQDALSEKHPKVEIQLQQDRQSDLQEEKQGMKLIKNKKKPLKDDYHKNAPNFITKSCIKEFTKTENKAKIQKICQKYSIAYDQTMGMVKNWNDIQTIGLGDLHDILWLSKEAGYVFKSFFKTYLRKQYMFNLLKSRIKKKQIYIEYKNVLLYLATMDGPWTNIKLGVKY